MRRAAALLTAGSAAAVPVSTAAIAQTAAIIATATSSIATAATAAAHIPRAADAPCPSRPTAVATVSTRAAVGWLQGIPRDG